VQCPALQLLPNAVPEQPCYGCSAMPATASHQVPCLFIQSPSCLCCLNGPDVRVLRMSIEMTMIMGRATWHAISSLLHRSRILQLVLVLPQTNTKYKEFKPRLSAPLGASINADVHAPRCPYNTYYIHNYVIHINIHACGELSHTRT
jgi:hypothetical protein